MIVDDIEKLKLVRKDTMRYDTCGDWHDDGTIEVYDKLDPLAQVAVGIHELIEMILLHGQDVTEQDVDQWDGVETGKYDAGMYEKDPRYAQAHALAEKVERMIIEAYGADWDQYNDDVDAVKIKWNKPKPTKKKS